MGRRLTQEEIFQKIKVKCIDVDCSKVVVSDLHTEVVLICQKHGEYRKTPHKILYGNYQCPVCTQLHKKKVLSEIGKANAGENNPFFGKHHTQKTLNQIKKTNLEKYGVKCASKSIQVRQKIQKTVSSKSCQDQIKQTNYERYGCEWATQNEQVKEKTKQTNIERYGVNTPAQNKTIADKISNSLNYRSKEEKQQQVQKSKQTKLERYGDTAYNNREQAIHTNLEKYGVNQPFLYGSPEFTQLMVERYGTDYQAKILKKSRQTAQENLELFEKQNNCTSQQKLIDRYGQGWLSIKDTLTTLTYNKNVFIENSDISKIELYASTVHNQNHISSVEKEVVSWIRSIYSGTVKENVRDIIPPKELDVYIPDKQLAIEFNGTYWHSNVNKPRNYHFEKSKECEKLGIRLIHIYEWDWPSDKVKSLLKISLGCAEQKIYARNCDLRLITNEEAKPFNEQNHLQGHRNAQVTYGLFHKGELVQLMSFSKTRYNRNLHSNTEWEIIRGCPGSNNIVVGGVEKLFKRFLTEYHPTKVFSYCDFNKFDGNSYQKIGMKFVGYTGPDKIWIIKGEPVKRNPSKYKELKSQADYIVWGSGSKKYEWRIDA